MFFLKELTHKLQLSPECFGPHLHIALKSRLLREVEGTCSGRFGYIITVLEIASVSHGAIVEGSGNGAAEFVCKYRAVLFKPFKGEVVDAVVTTVNKMGFFAEVGPLTIFVSNHLIPSEFVFDGSTNMANPSYVAIGIGGDVSNGAQISQSLLKGTILGSDGPVQTGLMRISKEDHVRLRIIGTRVDATEIFAIGTIKEDYLGLI